MLIVLVLVVLLYAYLTRNKNYWKNLGVPFDKPVPLFGSLLPLAKQAISVGDFFCKLYRSTDHPYYGLFILGQPSLLLRDPRLIQDMLIGDFECFQERMGGKCDHDQIGTNILFYMKASSWKVMRGNLSPFFSSSKLSRMLELINSVGENLVSHIRKKTSVGLAVNSLDASTMYVTDIVASCFFGFISDSLSKGVTEFLQISELWTKLTFMRVVQTSCFVFVPTLAKMFKIKLFDQTSEKYLQDVFLQVMGERKRSGQERRDLVDLLIKIEKEQSHLFKREEIIAQTLQLHFGSYDTTSYSTSFALYELCANVGIQKKLRGEINSVLSQHEIVSLEAIKKMSYLHMVVSESLRKHPIIPIMDRVCSKPYTIPNSSVTIKAGTPCFVSIYGLHYDSRYFPNPETFDPERFSPENKANIIPGTYIPFGVGPRNCIGSRFAVLAVKVALICIIRNFEFELAEDAGSFLGYDRKAFLLTPRNKSLNIKYKPIS
ncbi:hypothetical protein PPYR_08619 [Photinus pyralis]|uniref:Cytochrome P450 n=2 Tax=Photinus pyralis TaxID=7054 RepID=A0A5N4AK00_PHOPY|nr:hypothetical protein PPYR_08619 [Photinus pyralis]